MLANAASHTQNRTLVAIPLFVRPLGDRHGSR
jgi:hypothetical protein